MGARRETPVPAAQMPELRFSSDITWAQWEIVARENVANVRYILVHACTNAVTQRAVRRACQSFGTEKPGRWPGVRVIVDSEVGRALLGMYLPLIMMIVLRTSCMARVSVGIEIRS
jgi:hypothetical protein